MIYSKLYFYVFYEREIFEIIYEGKLNFNIFKTM